MTQVLCLDIFFEKDLHLNAVEQCKFEIKDSSLIRIQILLTL